MTAPAKAAPMREDVTQAVERVQQHIRESEDVYWGGPKVSPTPLSFADLRLILAHTAPPDAAPMREDVTQAIDACPFCTGKAALDQFCPTNMNEWRVICDGCEAWGPERKTGPEAIAAWNHRIAHTARPDAGDEDVERVARALYEEDDPWHKAWPWPNLNPEAQGGQSAADTYRRLARAALAAVREGVDRGMVERRDRYLASLFDTIFERFCEGEFEIEVNDLITDGALSAGLVECVAFDPDEHIDVNSACETGDNFYQITAAGREVIARARQKPAALSPEQPR